MSFTGTGVLPVISVAEALASATLDGENALGGQICRVLRRLAVELKLLPNQSLSEKDVADAFGVSRNPVREAFIRLAEDGIVRIVPKSGTYVSPIDPERAFEGFVIWNSLEAACAAQVAERSSLGRVRLFRELLDRLKAAMDRNDIDAFNQAYSGFHDMVIKQSEFPFIVSRVNNERFEMDRLLVLKRYCGLSPSENVLDEVSEVVNAIARRDAEGARASMRLHLRMVLRSMEGFVRDKDSWQVFKIVEQNLKQSLKKK